MNNLVRMPRGGTPVPQDWDCSTPGGGSPPGCAPPGWPPPGCPPWYSGMNSPPWYPGANAGVSFGTTAPVNPIRGHFWWDGVNLWLFDGAMWVSVGGSGGVGGVGVIISPTPPPTPANGAQWWNGTVLYVWDGTTWNAIGPGQGAGPVPTMTAVLAVAQPSQLTVTTSVWVPIPFTSTPAIDPMAAYDPVSHRFTPKKSGNYEFFVRGYDQSGLAGIAIIKNDVGSFSNVATDNVVGIQTISGTGTTSWMAASGITPMNGTTDFVRAWGYASSGVWNGAGSNPAFSGWLFP